MFSRADLIRLAVRLAAISGRFILRSTTYRDMREAFARLFDRERGDALHYCWRDVPDVTNIAASLTIMDRLRLAHARSPALAAVTPKFGTGTLPIPAQVLVVTGPAKEPMPQARDLLSLCPLHPDNA
jgi:hypothetical protein